MFAQPKRGEPRNPVALELIDRIAVPVERAFDYARDPSKVAKQIREAHTFSLSSLSPVALLLSRDLMED